MKFSFVFGFILLILLVIGIFIGLPYAIKMSKSGSFFLPLSFPGISLKPKISAPTMPAIGRPSVPGVQITEPAIKIGESLYKGKVSIGGINFFGANSISLRASYFSGGAVDITGWKIKSAQRGETIIGSGVGLPQFEVAPSDIWLSSGDSVDIALGLSPLGGNFRANNCFGWLNNLYNFGYSLNYCPGGFKTEDLTGLDSACQDLILRAGYCRTLSDNDLNQESSQCRQWAEKNMNYNSCVINHRSDSDFYKEWKLYTGNDNQFFNPLHDIIELRDQAGLLVDSYEY